MPVTGDEDCVDFGNQLQYVFTNPPRDTVIRRHDKVFLLVSTKVSWVINTAPKLRAAYNGKGSGTHADVGSNGAGPHGAGAGPKETGGAGAAEAGQQAGGRGKRRVPKIHVLNRGGVRLDASGKAMTPKSAAVDVSAADELTDQIAKLRLMLSATCE